MGLVAGQRQGTAAVERVESLVETKRKQQSAEKGLEVEQSTVRVEEQVVGSSVEASEQHKTENRKAVEGLVVGERQDTAAVERVGGLAETGRRRQSAKKETEVEQCAIRVVEQVVSHSVEEREQQASMLQQAAKGSEGPKQVIMVESQGVEETTKKEAPQIEQGRAAVGTLGKENITISKPHEQEHVLQAEHKIPLRESINPVQDARQEMETMKTETVSVKSQKNSNKMKVAPTFSSEQGTDSPAAMETAVSLNDLETVVKTATRKISEGHYEGMTVSQATSLLSAPELVALETPTAQVALLGLARRLGSTTMVQEAVLQEVAASREAVQSVGLSALLVALEQSEASSTDLVANFIPEDFDQRKVQATLSEVLNEAYQVNKEEEGEEVKEYPINADRSMRAIRSLAGELSHGREVGEIVASSALSEVQEMQCLETQMAIVSVLDRLGHGQVTEQVVMEALGGERVGLLNTVGSRALASTISQEAVTTEQVLTCLQEEDLKPDAVRQRMAEILSFAQTVNMAQVEERRCLLLLGLTSKCLICQRYQALTINMTGYTCINGLRFQELNTKF